MRQLIFSFILTAFLLLASLPQVQAANVIEKFPTSTTEIVGTWTNTTNAYAKDGVYTNTSMAAIQEYSGFGFSSSSSKEVESVYLKTKYYFTVSLAVDYVSYRLQIYNGTWQNQYAFYLDAVSGFVIAIYRPVDCAFDITSIIKGNQTLLENLSLRIQNYSANGLSLFVDYLSVEVVYSDTGAAAGPGTPEENPGSWLHLPTLNEFIAGIQQDFSHISQTLASSWNDVRYSNSFRLLLVLGLIGGLGLLVSLGRSKKQPRRAGQY